MVSQTIFLVRGPVIVLGVIACLLWPHVSQWSPSFILQLILAFLGIMCFLHDFFNYLQQKMRDRISTFLDEFVLDDFLRILYDPDTGLIPCSVATFMGAFSMYAFRLDEGQKTKLIQSTLWTTEEEAHSILLSAGGTKALLPKGFQSWLNEEEKEPSPLNSSVNPEPNSVFVETVEESASDSSISEFQNHTDDSPTCKEIGIEQRDTLSGDFPRRDNSGLEQGRPGIVFFNEHQRTMPPEIPTDPLAIMFDILRDKTMEVLRPWFAAIPASKLELLGTVATVGLCSQLYFRFRSKRTLAGSVSAICLSGTALGAFSSVLVRQAVLGNIQDMPSAKQCIGAMIRRSLGHAMNLLRRNKWLHGALALIILSQCGDQRRINTGRRTRTS